MRFLLLNNSEISSLKWVMLVPEEPQHAHYCAGIIQLQTDQHAREYAAQHDCRLVPGQPWALWFAGVANSPRLPVSCRYEEEIPEFLEQAAIFCASLTW